MMNNEIKSPCILECNLNENNICTGCYRHKCEIVTWKNLNDLAKQCVIDNANKKKNK